MSGRNGAEAQSRGIDPMKKTSTWAIALTAGMIAGCGMVVTTDYPNRLMGGEGQVFVLEDLEEIADIPEIDLGEDGKRALLRDLGIEDEELIDALLGL